MFKVKGWILLFICFSANHLAAQPAYQLKVLREKVLNFNMQIQEPPFRVTSGPYVKDTGLVWKRLVQSSAKTTAIRIHFRLDKEAAHDDWRIRIKDFEGNEIETIPAFESETWSDEIPGNGAYVELWSDQRPGDLQFTVDKYAFRTIKAFPQGIVGADDRLPISSVEPRIQSLGRSVARLRFIVADIGQGTCTAFLLTKDLLMTNYHCIHSDAEMRSSIAEFGYDAFGSIPLRMRARKLEAADPELDFSILRLTEALPDYAPLRLNPVDRLPENEKLIIIEHPAGEPKQVSIKGCFVNVPNLLGFGDTWTDFGHPCDTLGGSSGSPVLASADGRVLGLHHLTYDPNQPVLANQAVYIAQILDRLSKSNLPLYQEIQNGNQ